jgi:hypothetical protein
MALPRSDVSFPEPVPFNGPDDDPIASSRGRYDAKHDATRSLKVQLRAYLSAFGVDALQRVLVDVLPEDTQFAAWVDQQQKEPR